MTGSWDSSEVEELSLRLIETGDFGATDLDLESEHTHGYTFGRWCLNVLFHT